MSTQVMSTTAVSAPVDTVQARSLALHAFYVLIFFIHYQTIGVPGTLHSWALAAGFALTLPSLIARTVSSNMRLPLDLAVIALIAAVMILSFFANMGSTTLLQLQAYLLAAACYVFVRENAHLVSTRWIHRLMLWFLVINSILMALQLTTGSFFIARPLAAGDPPFVFPSGVSDGPTKNGMLHAFALSMLFGRLAATPRRSAWEVAAFLLGFVTLVISGSRAAVVAFVAGAIACVILMRLQQKRVRTNGPRRSVVRVAVPFAALVGVLTYFILAIPRLTGDLTLNYAASVIAYKFTVSEGSDFTAEEGSIDTRFHQARRALTRASESPVQAIGVGFGPGSFESAEGLNVHNSYLEFFFEMGLVGFLALAFLTVYVARRALAIGDREHVLPLATALAAMMAFMAFHDVLRGRMFWIPLGMLANIAFSTPALRPRRERSV